MPRWLNEFNFFCGMELPSAIATLCYNGSGSPTVRLLLSITLPLSHKFAILGLLPACSCCQH